MNKTDTHPVTEVREQILDSALKRFTQYGFGKTTMAEIAKDCRMSAANLYRFFENKDEIGVALACNCLGEKERRLREVLGRPGLSAGQRLETFILESFRYVHEQFNGLPHINELVNTVTQEHPDVVTKHKGVSRVMIAQILTEGHRSGEFDVADAMATAEVIMAATTMFCVPYFLSWHGKEEFEQLVRDVVGLIVRGLAKR